MQVEQPRNGFGEGINQCKLVVPAFLPACDSLKYTVHCGVDELQIVNP
jgi:hypothetical protein